MDPNAPSNPQDVADSLLLDCSYGSDEEKRDRVQRTLDAIEESLVEWAATEERTRTREAVAALKEDGGGDPDYQQAIDDALAAIDAEQETKGEEK